MLSNKSGLCCYFFKVPLLLLYICILYRYNPTGFTILTMGQYTLTHLLYIQIGPRIPGFIQHCSGQNKMLTYFLNIFRIRMFKLLFIVQIIAQPTVQCRSLFIMCVIYAQCSKMGWHKTRLIFADISVGGGS